MTKPLSVRQTLLLLLIPMLATFAVQRLYLHFVGVHHIRANGLIIHHLFFGVMTIIPAAFVLAFFFPGWNMLAMLPTLFIPTTPRA